MRCVHRLHSIGRWTIAAAAGLVALLLALADTTAPDGATSPATHATQTTQATQANGSAASAVYKDPVTGRLGPPPAGATRQLNTESATYSTDSRDLKEVPSPVAGGGFMVHLNGRFRHAIASTADARGVVSTDCESTEGKE